MTLLLCHILAGFLCHYFSLTLLSSVFVDIPVIPDLDEIQEDNISSEIASAPM